MDKTVKEDNPVPSLDIEILTDIKDLLTHQLQIEETSEMDNREYMVEYLEKLLQNGVETDNEQPKELIQSLHKFNKLDKRILQQIGYTFKFDAIKYCNDNGITYNIG